MSPETATRTLNFRQSLGTSEPDWRMLDPEGYARTTRMIKHDFVFFGVAIVATVVGLVGFLNLA